MDQNSPSKIKVAISGFVVQLGIVERVGSKRTC